VNFEPHHQAKWKESSSDVLEALKLFADVGEMMRHFA
jgi:hypothetical protein